MNLFPTAGIPTTSGTSSAFQAGWNFSVFTHPLVIDYCRLTIDYLTRLQRLSAVIRVCVSSQVSTRLSQFSTCQRTKRIVCLPIQFRKLNLSALCTHKPNSGLKVPPIVKLFQSSSALSILQRPPVAHKINDTQITVDIALFLLLILEPLQLYPYQINQTSSFFVPQIRQPNIPIIEI